MRRNYSFRSLLTRRHLIVGMAALWSGPVAGQQSRVPVVGVLRINPKDVNETFVEPFQRYMKDLGWEEGRNVRFQFLWAGGQYEQLPVLARELAERKVDLIITFGNPAVQAVQRVTTTIPIVGMTDDMVRAGLAASMARPGGNTTGVSILGSELDVKRHELLHEFAPQARQIAVLADSSEFTSRLQLESASRVFGVELFIFTAQNRDEIRQALDAMESARVEAVNILASPVLNAARAFIIDRLRRARLPSIFEWPESAEDGGLLGYGPRFLLVYRHVAGLVDKVLRGTAPADLPIEQPTRFELVINLKTAKAIGFDVPPMLLARADAVIE
jgi:putative tryptophan/tyrosine transport system substrate-binding protein